MQRSQAEEVPDFPRQRPRPERRQSMAIKLGSDDFGVRMVACDHKREASEGVKKSLKNQNSLTQRREVAKVAKQTKEFLLSDLCALAPLREAVHFFTASHQAEEYGDFSGYNL